MAAKKTQPTPKLAANFVDTILPMLMATFAEELGKGDLDAIDMLLALRVLDVSKELAEVGMASERLLATVTPKDAVSQIGLMLMQFQERRDALHTKLEGLLQHAVERRAFFAESKSKVAERTDAKKRAKKPARR